ncbi:hypothetical protein BDW74DRAFT_182966 [Aspergillus multicolor]|uniref:uncharacterized protein n=1 Tax=Aspergillus multicolor TaxID=41759 RepID=UPI003CCCD8EE
MFMNKDTRTPAGREASLKVWIPPELLGRVSAVQQTKLHRRTVALGLASSPRQTMYPHDALRHLVACICFQRLGNSLLLSQLKHDFQPRVPGPKSSCRRYTGLTAKIDEEPGVRMQLSTTVVPDANAPQTIDLRVMANAARYFISLVLLFRATQGPYDDRQDNGGGMRSIWLSYDNSS